MNKKENIIIFLLKSPFYTLLHMFKNNCLDLSIAFLCYFLLLLFSIIFQVLNITFFNINKIINKVEEIYDEKIDQTINKILNFDSIKNIVSTNNSKKININNLTGLAGSKLGKSKLSEQLRIIAPKFNNLTGKYTKFFKNINDILNSNRGDKSIEPFIITIGRYLNIFVIVNFYMSLQRSADLLWDDVHKLINPNKSIFSKLISLLYKQITGIVILITFAFLLSNIIGKFIDDFNDQIKEYISDEEDSKTFLTIFKKIIINSLINVNDDENKDKLKRYYFKNIHKNIKYRSFIKNIYPKIIKFKFINLFTTIYLLQILLSNLDFNLPLLILLIPGSLIMTFCIINLYNRFQPIYKNYWRKQKTICNI